MLGCLNGWWSATQEKPWYQHQYQTHAKTLACLDNLKTHQHIHISKKNKKQNVQIPTQDKQFNHKLTLNCHVKAHEKCPTKCTFTFTFCKTFDDCEMELLGQTQFANAITFCLKQPTLSLFYITLSQNSHFLPWYTFST